MEWLLVAGGASLLGAGTWYVLKAMARRALRPVVNWEPVQPALGESVQVRVDVCPRQSVMVDEVTASLVAVRYYWEDKNPSLIEDAFSRLVRGPGERDVPCQANVLLCRAMVFEANHPVRLEGKIDLPWDALPTNEEGRLQIHWHLEVRFKVHQFAPAVVQQRLCVTREPRGRKRIVSFRTPEGPPAAARGLEMDEPPGPSAPPWPLRPPRPSPLAPEVAPGPADKPEHAAGPFAHLELDAPSDGIDSPGAGH